MIYREISKSNFHIHSNFSDGKNSVMEIIRAALILRMDYIAITDHFSNSWKSNIIQTLNSKDSIIEYIDTLNLCQEYLTNLNSNLVLLKGIEVDLYSTDDFIEKNLSPENFDIVLFEYLESKEEITFLENIIDFWRNMEGLNQLPLLGIAHFDPSVFFKDDHDVLIEFLESYGLFYEFNESYSKFFSSKYDDFFEKIRNKRIPISIGCDSHDIRNLYSVEKVIDAIENYDLIKNYDKFLESVRSAFKS
ncbi:MAG: PHP domain-containing protein [Candidatus Lokiarchaeota archaeon]|nr:PHP domain-containing protein [Candidatus Lokiarchaeota archaeon]